MVVGRAAGCKEGRLQQVGAAHPDLRTRKIRHGCGQGRRQRKDDCSRLGPPTQTCNVQARESAIEGREATPVQAVGAPPSWPPS